MDIKFNILDSFSSSFKNLKIIQTIGNSAVPSLKT